jgi:uncharacterized protein YjbJ (UPF0337 family)
VNQVIGSEDTGSTTARVEEKAQAVVSQAQAKAQPAVEQARERVRDEVDRRSTQAGEQLSSVAQIMRRTGEELRSQGNEPHGKVADAAAERMDQVGGYLQRVDADTILSDVEDVARRQPLVAVAGGLLLGLAAARFLKASSDRRYDGYRARSDDRTRADYGTGAAYRTGADYPAGGDYATGTGYPAATEYPTGADYRTGADYSTGASGV